MATWKLRSGEKVLAVGRPAIAAVWPKYLISGGLYGFWHRRRSAVLTNERLVLGRGVLSRRERSIPIKTISSAGYFRKGLAAYCELTLKNRDELGAPPTRVGPLQAQTARRFVDELQSRI